jgi:branched-chain amino acid transport system ATP-binding protein
MTLLQTHNLSAFYGDFQALFDINVTVDEGETVAIIGANGAGKTTFLRAVAGALETAPDMVMFEGRSIGHHTAHDIVRLGIAMAPEGRRLFPSLSVEENLLLGGYSKRPGPWNLKRIAVSAGDRFVGWTTANDDGRAGLDVEPAAPSVR